MKPISLLFMFYFFSELRWLRCFSVMLCGVLCLVSGATWAQNFPAKPLSLIVPTAPGGPVDLTARMVANELAGVLGQRIVIINKPGASQKIGMETLLNSPRDGYTFAACSGASMTINPAMDKSIGYDPIKDFVMLANGMENIRVLVVNPNVPAKTLSELVAYARANPGKLTYGSGGNGSTLQFSSASFLSKAGIDVLHVPYKSSGPALMALLAGEISMLMPDIGDASSYISNGNLVAIATTGNSRSDKLPNVPTVAEVGLPELKNWNYSSWIGFVAAQGIPAEAASKLQASLVNVLHTPKMREAFEKIGATALGTPSDQFLARVKEELEVNQKLVSSGKVKP